MVQLDTQVTMNALVIPLADFGCHRNSAMIVEVRQRVIEPSLSCNRPDWVCISEPSAAALEVFYWRISSGGGGTVFSR